MRVDIVVVGGGIGGLGSALALARTGQRVRVLEQAAEFGEVGAGLQIAPNATRILRDWGLLDDVIAAGVLPHRLVLRDAVDGTELTYLDLADTARRYGAPYVVMHRSDLHAILLGACRDAGVDLVTGANVSHVEVRDDAAVAISASRRDCGAVVLAADGLTSTLRGQLSADAPVSSNYVAYRGAIPIDDVRDVRGLALNDVVVYIGTRCHFVQYPLRRGEMFNQVAVFESPAAVAGETVWGSPEELDAAFASACEEIRSALPFLWRNRCWRMYDREPLECWLDRRLALTGDAAHPMLQYLAQGACQALEDADCLATQVAKHTTAGEIGWDAALRAYNSMRARRTAQVQRTVRSWGDLWHADGLLRAVRNELFRDRDPADYRHIDWLYAP
jgi:3-hydroxybenzoate 6-monooxygenase